MRILEPSELKVMNKDLWRITKYNIYPGARPTGSLGTKASSERKAAGTAREEKQEGGGEESLVKGVMMMTSDDGDGDADVMIEKASIFES